MTADQTYELFAKQWAEKDPSFRLDDPQVREQLMVLVSAALSLLAIAPPEVWQDFMDECSRTAKAMVPEDIQARIKGATG